MTERRFDSAIVSLQAALVTSGRPDYGGTPNETADLLEQGRKRKSAADAAQKALEEARVLGGLKTGRYYVPQNLVAALRKLQEARRLDPGAPGITEIEAAIAPPMQRMGEATLAMAKNHDAAGRTTEAIQWYERALSLLELLPQDHGGVAVARERLAQLKGR